MARITDPEKLERIKESTMEHIAANGYQGVTIASIAKNAGVSAGYLYNHFASKEELICSLIDECYPVIRAGVYERIQKKEPFEAILSHLFRSILTIANREPKRAGFICALAHDSRFRDMFKKDGRLDFILGIEKLLQYAKKQRCVNGETTMVDMMLFTIDLPINYMFYRINEAEEPLFITESDVEKLVTKACKALS